MSTHQSAFRPDHLAPEAIITGTARTSRPDLEAQLLLVGRLLYQERINNSILERQLSSKTIDYGTWQLQKQQMDHLTSFIYHYYHREVQAGQHAGKTIPQIVERYLKIERGRLRVKLAGWWWHLTERTGD